MHEVNQSLWDLAETLRGASGPLPGPALARQRGLSRVALWKQIQALEGLGLRVQADRRGYRLVEDRLPWRGRPGELLLPETSSTMEEAARRARLGCSSGTVVGALRQKGGRGQRGRTWVSPPGSWYGTLVLRAPWPASLAGALMQEALAWICERSRSGAPLKDQTIRARWPNDLVAGGQKIGGLLLESLGSAEAPEAWLLGLGLNLSPEAPPVEGAGTLGSVPAWVDGLGPDLAAHLEAWMRQPRFDPASWESRQAFETGPCQAQPLWGPALLLDRQGLGPEGQLRARASSAPAPLPRAEAPVAPSPAAPGTNPSADPQAPGVAGSETLWPWGSLQRLHPLESPL